MFVYLVDYLFACLLARLFCVVKVLVCVWRSGVFVLFDSLIVGWSLACLVCNLVVRLLVLSLVCLVCLWLFVVCCCDSCLLVGWLRLLV